MPKFLSRQEVYRVLQRELPEDVFPDGPPSAFFSTADMDSVAQAVASAYDNQERIYDNFFPATADEQIADWQITVFGHPLDSSLTLQEQRDAVLFKLRNRIGIKKSDMLALVKSFLPTGVTVRIKNWNCEEDADGFILDVSLLDADSLLWGSSGLEFPGFVGGDLACQTPESLGITAEEWATYQSQAYTYQVNVYDYTLSTAEREAIDAALTTEEPARSTHVIYDGLTGYLETEDGDDVLTTEDGEYISL